MTDNAYPTEASMTDSPGGENVATSGGGKPLLQVKNLTVQFRTGQGILTATEGVSLSVDRGETRAIVGESGSGKTVSSEAITRLIKTPPGEIVEGEVIFDGENLTDASSKRLRQIRGGRIAHIFQNPQDALNPMYTIGEQIREMIQLHDVAMDETPRERAINLLNKVGIPEASSRVDNYPHEFSGGQKQRIMISIALAADPDLLIADEPTTALDVTIQAQILRLLKQLQDELGMAILLVTHDLGVVAQMADRVTVMYAGKVMEQGGVYEIFENPAHPYTRAFLRCQPGMTGGEMGEIEGQLPSPINPPDGCRFADRCAYTVEACRVGDHPELHPVGDESDSEHQSACIHHAPDGDPSMIAGGPPGPAAQRAANEAAPSEQRTDGGYYTNTVEGDSDNESGTRSGGTQ